VFEILTGFSLQNFSKDSVMYEYQFGCGISKMVDPKKQDFCPRINMLKRKKRKNSADELWFIEKYQDRILKVDFFMSKIGQIFPKKNFH
jgi:hypothetical protein